MNSQLLEAIQQKIELSQQLEEWQSDMEVLLEDQIRDRLVQSERARAQAAAGQHSAQQQSMASAAGSKLLSFFTSKAEKI